MNYDTLFMNPKGRTSRGQFAGALIPLLGAAAFYLVLPSGPTAPYCLTVLLLPAMILHARRLHDMGLSAWPVLIPGVVDAAALFLHFPRVEGQYKGAATVAAAILSVGFLVWGVVGKGQAGANRFGEPATA